MSDLKTPAAPKESGGLLRSCALSLPGAALLVCADQMLKRVTVNTVWPVITETARVTQKPVGHIPLIEGFLGFTHVENIGASFGMLEGARWLFIPLTFAVLALIAVYYVRLPRGQRPMRLPLTFIFAGACGNLIDRVRTGYVVDMLEFLFIQFPIFNAADCCLVGGTAVLALMMLFAKKEKPAA